MTDEGLAILRELVDRDDAGLDITDGGASCLYCDADAHPEPPNGPLVLDTWICDHAPDCPIRRGRSLLLRYVPQPS